MVKFNFDDDDDFCEFEYDKLHKIVENEYKTLEYYMLPTFEGWVFSHMKEKF